MVSSKLFLEEADAGTLVLPLYAERSAKLIQETDPGGNSESERGRERRSGRRFSGREETEGEREGEGEGERCGCKSDSDSDSLSVRPSVLPNGPPRFRSPVNVNSSSASTQTALSSPSVARRSLFRPSDVARAQAGAGAFFSVAMRRGDDGGGGGIDCRRRQPVLPALAVIFGEKWH